MAAVNFFDNFETPWAQNGSVEAIDDNQYKQGWAYIGATPPSVEQFNKVQQLSDQKAAWLFSQLRTVADTLGVQLTAADAAGLQKVLAKYAALTGATFTGAVSFPTPTAGDNDTSGATTAFVQTAVNGKLSKSVAGTGTVTLTATEAGYGQLEFTGALTGNRTVVVPGAAARWIVLNKTTGAFSLTVKTSDGTGIVVGQGKNTELVCDGTNVLSAKTDFPNVALTGTATAPTPPLASNDTSIATTEWVLDQFTGSNQSFGVSGFQKLPGGLILQWGYVSGFASYTITLPTAFPVGPLGQPMACCLGDAVVSTTAAYAEPTPLTGNSFIIYTYVPASGGGSQNMARAVAWWCLGR